VAVIAVALGLCVSGCAPRVSITLPGGVGRSEPAAIGYFEQARATCAGVRSWSAELGLGGRVRGQAARGRVLAGSRESGDLRLEGVAPFGAPLFILVALHERASVLLPREERILRDVPARDVLDALVALPLSASDLHALLTGCLVTKPVVANPRALDGGWVAVDVGDRMTAFLRDDGSGWRIRLAQMGDLSLSYDAFEAGGPREIAIVSRDPARRDAAPFVQLRLRLAQVEPNAPLDDSAFTVDVPADARPMGIDELRTRGIGWRQTAGS
jgi:hypothetical protein